MTGSEIVFKIESRLKELGIKKSQFYSECGVSSASFSQWRLGHHLPEHTTLLRINRYLGTSFELADANEKTATSNDDGLTPEQRELMNLVPSMTQAEVLVLLAAAKAQEAARRNQGSE